MIIVASNWALGDGTLVSAGPASRGSLATAIHRAAIQAGVGADGRYRPIDALDLVLAGDTFDWLVSAEWLGDAKPWHQSAAARDRLGVVARRSIRLGRAALAPLLGWVRRGMAVPTGMVARGPRHSLAVPVRVTLLAGDRDAPIERILGGRSAFTVGRRWDDGRLTVRHGHDRDPACVVRPGRGTAWAERPPSLAESVAVDLVARFAAAVAGCSTRTAADLRRLAEAGVVGIPEVLRGWLTGPADGQGAGAIGDAWLASVDRWWREARRCVPTCEAEFDAVDAVAAWFAAAVRPDAETCPIAAGLGGLVAASVEGGPGVVEGHLRGPGPRGAVGLAPLAAAASPLAVCASERGWPRWRLVSVGAHAEAVVAIRSRTATTHADRRVVDAA